MHKLILTILHNVSIIHTLQNSKNFLASSSETKLSPHAWLSVVRKKSNLQYYEVSVDDHDNLY